MTRAREGHNSIPITLVGTVLQRIFSQVSGHIRVTTGEGILLIDAVVAQWLIVFWSRMDDLKVSE